MSRQFAQFTDWANLTTPFAHITNRAGIHENIILLWKILKILILYIGKHVNETDTTEYVYKFNFDNMFF